MKIRIPYPENISEEDRFLFDNILSYEVNIPKIKSFKNVFVSNDGLVLQRFLLNKRSAYNLKGKKDINFFWPYWKLILEQYLVCLFGKSLKSKHYTDTKYAIVHTKWFNYSFWMTDALHRCILMEEFNLKEKAIILLPENYLEISFVKDTFSIFQFEVEIIPKDTHCFISNFILPETREYTSFFDPGSIQKIRDKLIPLALEKTNVTSFPNKIYLTRKERSVRSLINEDEVEQTLVNAGFVVLNFDNMSVWDQIAYMHHCSWFVSVHGAGFSNVMFMKSNSKVLEFLEYDFAHYGNPFPFWRLASIVKLKYHYLFGVSVETKFIKYKHIFFTQKQKRMSYVNRKMKIDLNRLKLIINE